MPHWGFKGFKKKMMKIPDIVWVQVYSCVTFKLEAKHWCKHVKVHVLIEHNNVGSITVKYTEWYYGAFKEGKTNTYC